MICFYYGEVNGENYQNSLFLDAFINVEIIFLRIGSRYSLLLTKSDILHSTGSTIAFVLVGAKGCVKSYYLNRDSVKWAGGGL